MIHIGDCRDVLRTLAQEGVKAQTCVTSPPYWGLRDYGHDRQLGLEATPEEYVTRMVEVFRLVRNVLTDDGTLWLNLGDSYAGSWGAQSRGDFYPGTLEGASDKEASLSARQIKAHPKTTQTGSLKRTPGLKNKDLVGIPWRVAFALQADGWYLRSDIVWAKPNPMPESVLDRPTKAHEYIFLLAKSERYYYDAAAIREPSMCSSAVCSSQNIDTHASGRAASSHVATGKDKQRGHGRRHAGFNNRWDHMSKTEQAAMGRNKRSVWTVSTKPYNEAHFATYPRDLIEPCVLAGSRAGDTVLDPFFGSGTTGAVAEHLGRNWIGIELNPVYGALATKRTAQCGLFTSPAGASDALA